MTALALAAAWVLPVRVAWQNSPDLGHAWAVPLLMAYLWWERWAERPALRAPVGWPAGAWWVLAGLLVAIEFPLRLFLTPFPLWPVVLALYTALFLAVALLGAWRLAGAAGVRWLAGPLILVLSVLPVPSLLENGLIVPLRTVWAALAAEISNLLGYPALAYGTSVRLGSGWVGIDDACGGIRSLQACVMIALFFGEWYRFRWTRRLALVGVGVGAALLGNFGRVLFLSLRALGGAGAVESAHDVAGWIAMAASLVLTGWLACWWGGYKFPAQVRAARPAGAAARSPAALWLAALALAFAAGDLGTRLWFARGEHLRRASIPQWTAAFPTRHWSYRPGPPLNEAARDLLRPDYFVAATWRADAETAVSAYYVEWRRGQVARSVPFLHNPTVCLPIAGCELSATLAPIPVPWAHGTIPFHAYRFRRAGEEILVAFTIWDPARGRPLNQPGELTSWSEWYRMQWAEVREARQNQPAQMLTISIPWNERAPAALAAILQATIAASGDTP